MQSVTKVIIGNKFVSAPAADGAGLAKGDVVLLDQFGKFLDAADVADVNSVSVAIVTNPTAKIMVKGEQQTKVLFDQSMPITRRSNAKVLYNENADPEPCTTTINFYGAIITAGNRYVIRNYYKDMFEDKAGFTHNYEVIALSTDAEELATAFMNKIRAHAGRRVEASDLDIDVDGGTPVDDRKINLTLTALEKDDNEGVDSITEYSIVDFATTVYETKRAPHILSNQWRPVQNIKVSTTTGTLGTGYWKLVRDLEKRNMGYNGIVYRDSTVPVEQKMQVVEDVKYDVLTVTYDNKYVSADNQYTKDVPLQLSVYLDSANAGTTEALATAIGEFVGDKIFPTV
jgi:hypothetical protein